MKLLAPGCWLLAQKSGRLVLVFKYFVRQLSVATLCRLGLGIGWPLGGPSVAQGRRKGDPGVDFKKALCLQQKVEKGRVGAP
jgi:hypothetical protein